MGYKSIEIAAVKFLTQQAPKLVGPGVTVDSGVTDTGNGLGRSSILRPGFVVVKKTSTGRYVAADDATGDRCAAAKVTAAQTADGTWASKTITINVQGGPDQVVTLGAGDDTDAEVVAAIMLQTTGVKATVVANRVTIQTEGAGRNRSLKVSSNLAAAFGAADGVVALGTDADYRVLGHEGHPEEYVDLLDKYGAAMHAPGVRNLLAGFFSAAALVKLTAEAQIVLGRNGSIFAA
jgi:hypothetical protein